MGIDLKNIINSLKYRNTPKKIILLFKGEYIENDNYIYNFPLNIVNSKIQYYAVENDNSSLGNENYNTPTIIGNNSYN